MNRRAALALLLLVAALGLVWSALRDHEVADEARGAAPSPTSGAPVSTPIDVVDGAGAAHAEVGGRQPAPGPSDGPSNVPPGSGSPVVDEELARPVALLLVGRGTGAPVPHFAFTVRDGSGAEELLESDANGEARGVHAFGAGTLTIDQSAAFGPEDLIQTWRDRAQRIPRSSRHQHDPATAALAPVVLDVGPTFQLDFGLPPGLSAADFDLRLGSADPSLAFDRLFARVRPEPRPWARFSALASALGGGPPWRLQLRSGDGLWSGVREIGELHEAAHRVQRFELMSCARLTGIVRGSNGAPVNRIWVRLEQDGGVMHEWDTRPLFALTDEDGRYDHRWIPPRTYSVVVELRRHARFAEERALAGGETAELDVVLEAAQDAPPAPSAVTATIAGTMTSTTGTFHAPSSVYLKPTLPGARVKRATVNWEERDGRWEGSFAAELAVDEGYRAAPEIGALFEVDPKVLECLPGGEPLSFCVLDDRPSVALAVAAFDRDSGAPVGTLRTTLDAVVDDRAMRRFFTGRGGLVEVEGLPVPPVFRLRTWAHGYQNAVIDESAVLVEGRVAHVRLDLEPGWSARVSVVGPDRVPVAGATISLDGRVVGETDERGVLEVSSADVPTRIAARFEDWRMVPNSAVNPETGHFRSWQPSVQVELAPPD